MQTLLLLPAGKAVDQIGRRPTLVVGGLLSAVSLVGLALATGPVSLLLAMTVFAAGAALLGVAPPAIVGDVVEGKGGTAVAVWQMSSDLGSVIGPLIAGLLIDRGSFGVALVFSTVVCRDLRAAPPARAQGLKSPWITWADLLEAFGWEGLPLRAVAAYVSRARTQVSPRSKEPRADAWRSLENNDQQNDDEDQADDATGDHVYLLSLDVLYPSRGEINEPVQANCISSPSLETAGAKRTSSGTSASAASRSCR